MPDNTEALSQHSRDVDVTILQQSVQGWASGCFCGGIKSEFFQCWTCSGDSLGQKVGFKPPQDELPWGLTQFPAAPMTQTVAATDNVALNPVESNAASTTAIPLASRVSGVDSTRLHDASPALNIRRQRGRPPNGSRQGPRHGFKGVRQRTKVRGYLVEIRPPRWNKTIWLGTFNTDAEAAGAYDAGVFYTKKKTRFNFPSLVKTFIPLPENLAFDRPSDANDIKEFVKKQAVQAAKDVKNMNLQPNTNSSSVASNRDQMGMISADTADTADQESASNNSLTEEVIWSPEFIPSDFSLDENFQPQPPFIPSFDEFAEQSMVQNYINLQQRNQIGSATSSASFELKEDDVIAFNLDYISYNELD